MINCCKLVEVILHDPNFDPYKYIMWDLCESCDYDYVNLITFNVAFLTPIVEIVYIILQFKPRWADVY